MICDILDVGLQRTQRLCTLCDGTSSFRIWAKRSTSSDFFMVGGGDGKPACKELGSYRPLKKDDVEFFLEVRSFQVDLARRCNFCFRIFQETLGLLSITSQERN